MKTLNVTGRILIGGLLAVLASGCGRTDPRPVQGSDSSGSTVQPIGGAAMIENTPASQTRKAMFGAGCFWGVEAAFRQVPGVLATRVGYAGGDVAHPTYEQVCTDQTGHAEVVEVVYDSDKVSYERLLDVFWSKHDPTQVNRQGPDVGRQYRSVIFYSDDDQMEAARKSLSALEGSDRYRRPIATQIEPAPVFYPAEEYHQQYLEKRGLSSCHVGLES